MNFRTWFESTVKFADIQDAIQKTLEFVVDDGRWKFEPKPYGMSGIKTVTVAGHFYCSKGHFFLTANTVDGAIDSYDSVTGDIDGNSKIEIIGSLAIISDNNPNGRRLMKVAERSNTTKGGRLHTPYELANWVKSVIDGWHPGGDDEDDDAPVPDPVDNQLVGV